MTDTTTADHVHIECDLSVDVETAWRAWTEPAVMAGWYCPNLSWEVRAEVDLHVGGPWRLWMGPRLVSGAYDAVAPPAELGFTWAWDHEPDVAPTTVRVRLHADGETTRLVLDHAGFADEAAAISHREGWEMCFARLGSLQV